MRQCKLKHFVNCKIQNITSAATNDNKNGQCEVELVKAEPNRALNQPEAKVVGV